MGCSSSSSSKPMQPSMAEMAAAEKSRREKLYEQQLRDKLYQQKDLLREMALPVMLAAIDEGAAEDEDDQLTEAQKKRKEAKLKAEAEQRWMIFSNCSTMEEADMLHVASFMDTLMSNFTELSLSAQSFEELNAFDEDIRLSASSPPQPLNDDVIQVARENSKEFISAIRSLSSSAINPSRGNSLSTISAPRLTSSNAIQTSRLNSKGTIEVPRTLSKSIVEASRSGSKNSIDATRTSSGSSAASGTPTTRNTTSPNDLFSLDRIVVETDIKKSLSDVAPSALVNFDLPPGLVNEQVASLVNDVYKRGGSLSLKSVHKLLKLSYRYLKKLPNTTYINVSGDERVTVVGDIHGQLFDLLHIVTESGMPSKSIKYLFNGDFVDRGAFGVECMCLLMALMLGFPDSVFLNRGNHEDFAICCTYGFQKECCTKYSDITFGMFVEVFHHIPLFAVINNEIFVVHGGLFHNGTASLQDLNHIKRDEFTLKDLPENGDQVEGMGTQNEVQYLKRLQRDALWSDPMDRTGVAVNPRGAGVAFGPDITRSFLQRNNLKLVVRSHECVRTGFEKPFTGDDANILFTVFSASNYGGGGNSAAYIVFSQSKAALSTKYNTVNPTTKERTITGISKKEQLDTDRNTMIGAPSDFDPNVSESNLTDVNTIAFNTGTEPAQIDDASDIYYSVFYFDLSSEDDDADEEDTVVDNNEFLYASYSDGLSLYDIILAHKPQLLEEFMKYDLSQTSIVTKAQWEQSLKTVIKLTLSWANMFQLLVLDECIVNNYATISSDKDDDHIFINYRLFLNSYTAAIIVNEDPSSTGPAIPPTAIVTTPNDPKETSVGILASTDSEVNSVPVVRFADEDNGFVKITDSVDDGDDKTLVTGSLIDTLYAQHRKLLAIFRFFDKENKGTISASDFYKGCEMLNKTLPPSSQIKDLDKLINTLDIAQRGEVDINVFFEMFRLSNIHAANHAQRFNPSAAELSSSELKEASAISNISSMSQNADSRARRNSQDELDSARELLRKPSFRRSGSSRLRADSIDSMHGSNQPVARSPYKQRLSRSGSAMLSFSMDNTPDTVDINGIAVSVEKPIERSVPDLDDSISFRIVPNNIDV